MPARSFCLGHTRCDDLHGFRRHSMHRSTTVLVAIALFSSSLLHAAESVWIAVVGRDGILEPVGRYDAGMWSRPWPDATPPDTPTPAPRSVPARWWGPSPRPSQTWTYTSFDTGKQESI